jgi:transcriptional regulator with XRE-family HTH domain
MSPSAPTDRLDDELTIGMRIRLARVQRRKLVKDLAEAAGLSPSLLSKYESDRRDPRYSDLEHIAAALEMSVAELVSMKTSR